MILDILRKINQQANISKELLEALADNIKVDFFRKGEILLKEGSVCRNAYFVQKGCLRFYYVDEEGKDITHWFSFEGDFMTEVNSLFSQEPSDFYIEALEACELIMFSLDNLEELSNKFPEFSRIEKMVYRKYILELGDKIKDLQYRDAKTRYDNLIQKQEDVLLRVPLGYIASYLGITQQSLSRIRKQKMK